MSYISVDVDIDDILDSMSSRDKQKLAEELYDDGYVQKGAAKKEAELNDDFSLACEKLIGQSWRLTREEEEYIINLSKRF